MSVKLNSLRIERIFILNYRLIVAPPIENSSKIIYLEKFVSIRTNTYVHRNDETDALRAQGWIVDTLYRHWNVKQRFNEISSTVCCQCWRIAQAFTSACCVRQSIIRLCDNEVLWNKNNWNGRNGCNTIKFSPNSAVSLHSVRDAMKDAQQMLGDCDCDFVTVAVC